MIIKSFNFVFAACVTLLALWAVGFLWFSVSVAAAAPALPHLKTDAIIVLTGGTDRVSVGIDLLRKKKSGKLFISGVNQQTTLADLAHGEKNLPCCISLGHKANDTASNAEETQEWVDRNEIKSVRLVTSNYHMPRARLELQRVMPHVDIIPYPVEAPDTAVNTKKFWLLVFGEYNKTLATWLRHNILSRTEKS